MNNEFNYTFLQILVDCKKKYDLRRERYGDTWRNITIPELRKKLNEEIDELQTTFSDDNEYEELLDVINMALMLATRKNEEKKK